MILQNYSAYLESDTKELVVHWVFNEPSVLRPELEANFGPPRFSSLRE